MIVIIAIGKIVFKNNLVGVRIYNTGTKSIRDIKLDDANKIKIKNRGSINRLGIIDNKRESKPVVLLGQKNKKYIVIDINGRTKILDNIDKYDVVDIKSDVEDIKSDVEDIKSDVEDIKSNVEDIKSNVEEYKKYTQKLRTEGKKSYFKYDIRTDTDEVIITDYIDNGEEKRVIEIPSFVTGIRDTCDIDNENDSGYNIGIFTNVTQSLKVIHKYNQIKDMSCLFEGFKGKQLDLSNFDTSNVMNMYNMFNCCENLRKLDLVNFDTSKVTNMAYMFDNCINLRKLDLSNFDTSNITDMSCMFNNCNRLNTLNIRNFDTSNVTNMYSMFKCCNNLDELDLSNFDTSNVVNMSYMFYKCSNLRKIDLSNFDTSKARGMRCMFDETSLTARDTGLKY